MFSRIQSVELSIVDKLELIISEDSYLSQEYERSEDNLYILLSLCVRVSKKVKDEASVDEIMNNLSSEAIPNACKIKDVLEFCSRSKLRDIMRIP